jgi:hypothetical protein
MAARSSTRKRPARRSVAARGKTARSTTSSPRTAGAVARGPTGRPARIELPPSLAQFSRRVRTRLTQLERRIERAEARTRRRWTRLLRDASHRLGRFQAEGERRWRRLTARARREALQVLRRLERELEPPRRRRRPAGRPRTVEQSGSGI